MASEVDGYLKEVPDVEFVSEVLAERFDNALDLLPMDAVVYGGAVRDVLAGLPLLGDLDVAVSKIRASGAVRMLMNNPKWIADDSPLFVTSDGSGSPYPGELAAMTEVTQLSTINGATVQIVTSAARTGDALEDAIDLARKVDIVCCGMILTWDGTVYEALPGALDDCRNRVLRLNKASDTIFMKSLPKRVDKLVKRGWSSEINVKAAMAEANKREKKEPPAPVSVDGKPVTKIFNQTGRSSAPPDCIQERFFISRGTIPRVFGMADDFTRAHHRYAKVILSKGGMVTIVGRSNTAKRLKSKIRDADYRERGAVRKRPTRSKWKSI